MFDALPLCTLDVRSIGCLYAWQTVNTEILLNILVTPQFHSLLHYYLSVSSTEIKQYYQIYHIYSLCHHRLFYWALNCFVFSLLTLNTTEPPDTCNRYTTGGRSHSLGHDSAALIFLSTAISWYPFPRSRRTSHHAIYFMIFHGMWSHDTPFINLTPPLLGPVRITRPTNYRRLTFICLLLLICQPVNVIPCEVF